MTKPTEDALWPRASHWLSSPSAVAGTASTTCDIAVYGVRAHRTSISATGANHTPAAVRAALARYSTWAWSSETSVGGLVAQDFGDSIFPDSPEGEAATAELAGRATKGSKLAIA
ncbi:MAG: hypothetical protein RL672_832, partial [Actinomycetota bacterium]